jgi:hypothetical protein
MGRHTFTQFSQPQQEPVSHGTQPRPGGHESFGPHGTSHCPVEKSHTSPGGQGSLSSQRSGGVGTHAPRQSSQAGQLEVAQGSHTAPAPQSSHANPSHAGAHTPVPNRHRAPPPQSSWVVQGPGPVVTLVLVPPVLVVDPPGPAAPDELVPPVAPAPVVALAPPPPSPSTTTVPPHDRRVAPETITPAAHLAEENVTRFTPPL